MYKTMERCNLGSNMLEMTDYQGDISGKYGCPKYCPLYDTDMYFLYLIDNSICGFK